MPIQTEKIETWDELREWEEDLQKREKAARTEKKNSRKLAIQRHAML